MQRRLTTQDVTWFLDVNGLGRLDLEPSYQRKSVWTRRDRQYFLDTIFNNYPSPAIFLHKDIDDVGNTTYHVVDGKQRLESVLMFVDNKLPIPETVGDNRLANKRWRDLKDDADLKRRLWDYQFTVEMLDSIEPAVVNDVFGRLNQNSRKLTPQEIRHSRYDGWFVNFAESEADRPLWKQLRVSTTARARRMQDVQFISELMAVTIKQALNGFDQDWINEIYASHEDLDLVDSSFNLEDFESNFGRTATYLQEAEEHSQIVSSLATTFAHVYSLWGWLTLQPELPSVSRFADAYSQFMEAVKEVISSNAVPESYSKFATDLQAYADNARGASTDLKQREARHEALSNVLEELLRQ